MKTTKNLEDLGDLLKEEKKPIKKKEKTLDAVKPQVAKSGLKQIKGGLKIFR